MSDNASSFGKSIGTIFSPASGGGGVDRISGLINGGGANTISKGAGAVSGTTAAASGETAAGVGAAGAGAGAGAGAAGAAGGAAAGGAAAGGGIAGLAALMSDITQKRNIKKDNSLAKILAKLGV